MRHWFCCAKIEFNQVFALRLVAAQGPDFFLRAKTTIMVAIFHLCVMMVHRKGT
jgi:hypothetical protein